MKKTKINVFNTYIKSITDFNSYVSYFKLSMSKAFLYLLFLSIFLGCLSGIRPMLNFNNFIDSITKDYNKNTPEFTFKNGRLDIKSNCSYTYESSGSKYIIDTTGKTKSSILENQNGILITKDSIYQKDFAGKISRIPLNTFSDLSFNKSDLKKVLPRLKYLDIFIIIFSPIKFFISYMFHALLLSFIGMLIVNIIRMQLGFKDLFKISLYALTLPTTFNVIITSINKSSNNFNMYALYPIFFGVGCIYLIKALTVIKLNEKQL